MLSGIRRDQSLWTNGAYVKKKACFYYLPESIPMKYAFQGMRGSWFVHVEATTSTVEPYLLGSEANNHSDPLEPKISVTSNDKSERNTKGEGEGMKEKKCLLDHKANGDGDADDEMRCPEANNSSDPLVSSSSRYRSMTMTTTEAPSTSFSQVKSVSSIIRRYFPNSESNYDINSSASPTTSDVTSKIPSRTGKRFKAKTDGLRLDFYPKSPSTKGTLKGKINKAEFGKRFLMASSNYLEPSARKNKSAAYLSAKVLDLHSSVFEISDSDA